LACGQLGGQAVVISGDVDGRVQVWDPASGQPRKPPWAAHEGQVNDLAFGHLDGRPLLVSGGLDSMVRIWELEDPALSPTGTPSELSAGVKAVTFTLLKGQPVVAAATSDGAVLVWRADTGEKLVTLRARTPGREVYTDFALRAGRAIIVQAEGRDSVVLRDLRTGKVIGKAITSPREIRGLKCIGDEFGLTVMVHGRHWVSFWSSRNRFGRTRIFSPVETEHPVNLCVVASGRLPHFLTCVWRHASDAILSVDSWQLSDLDRGPTRLPLPGSVDARLWERPHSRYLAAHGGYPQYFLSGGMDGTVRLWTVPYRPENEFELAGHSSAITAVALGTINGQLIAASGSQDGEVHFWNAQTRKLSVVDVGSRVNCISMSPSSNTVAIAAEAGVVCLRGRYQTN
jgi:WD40 repeat protein